MKKKDTTHLRLLSSARKALTVRDKAAPVPALNARLARIDQARKRSRGPNEPTPEQEAKAQYVETNITDNVGGRKVTIGHAFRRQARFETIEGLTIDQLFALRGYRRAFDTSEMSATKSGLDIGPGGGTGGAWAAISRVETLAFADVEVKRIEATVSPSLLPTLRAIALHDDDFKVVALRRFGSASGQRRQRVKTDFLAAAADLAAAIVVSRQKRAVPLAASIHAAEPQPVGAVTVPVQFIDQRGYMRPFSEIADILRGAPAADDEAA